MSFRLIICFFIILPFIINTGGTSYKTMEDSIKTRISSKEKWEGKKSIQFNFLKKLGTDDYDKENYVLGVITDIKVDRDGNIYILDRDNIRVQKYSKDGEYLKSFGGTPGMGPGDLNQPRRFTLDNHLNIYINDLSPPRVVMFDATGKFVKSFILRHYPGDLIAGSNDDLYVSEIYSSGKYWIHRYKITSGQKEKDFCEKDSDDTLVKRSDYSGYLALDKNGALFFSFPWPYIIKQYSRENELLQSFTRKASFVKSPFTKGRAVGLRSRAVDLIYLPTGIIINICIASQKNGETNFYFDYFDENGDWLLTIPSTEIDPEWQGRAVACDLESNIYLDFSEPYPHVKKYSMKIVEK